MGVAARLLLEHGANQTRVSMGACTCVTIGSVDHGEQAKPLEQLLRRADVKTSFEHLFTRSPLVCSYSQIDNINRIR
jgi:hypothetical protein